MTQARHTNFHTYWTEKRLLPGESVSDFREVTAAERAALEKSDAAWVRPPQSFIDAWNEAWNVPGWFGVRTRYGQWNEETGFFEGNGLLNITYPQARVIMACPPQLIRSETNAAGNTYRVQYPGTLKQNCRTLIPWQAFYWFSSSFEWVWSDMSALEAVRWPTLGVTITTYPCKKALGDLGTVPKHNLKAVLGEINKLLSDLTVFYACPALESLTVYAQEGLDLSKCPKLTAESVQFTAGHIVSTQTAATVKLHPDVYAALTEDILELAGQTGVTFVA